MEWLVSDDPRAETLRKAAKIYVVPIMDIDNVAIGAGGKDQKPHDHNRDWSDQPHWHSVAAAQEHGVVVNAPNDETIRLVPALTIGDVELDEFVELFTASVRTVEDALLLETPTEVPA